jgi:tRNA(fMet)-specific endonuclease VapC
MSYLIDTDIVIYSLKGHDTVYRRFEAHMDLPKAISVVTYGELVYGAKKSTMVEKNLASVRRVSELFPIIELTKAIMDTFGELKSNLEKLGITIDDMDLLIGSTALTHHLTLVTNNEKHFKHIPGLTIENWSR